MGFYGVSLAHIVSDPGLKLPYMRSILALVGVIIALCAEVYFSKIPVPQSPWDPSDCKFEWLFDLKIDKFVVTAVRW